MTILKPTMRPQRDCYCLFARSMKYLDCFRRIAANPVADCSWRGGWRVWVHSVACSANRWEVDRRGKPLGVEVRVSIVATTGNIQRVSRRSSDSCLSESIASGVICRVRVVVAVSVSRICISWIHVVRRVWLRYTLLLTTVAAASRENREPDDCQCKPDLGRRKRPKNYVVSAGGLSASPT